MSIRALGGLASLFAALWLLGACASSPAPTPTPTPTVLSLRPVLASTDLAVGRNRLVFALLNPASAPIRASAVHMALSYVQDNTLLPKGAAQAIFRPWPAGPGGVFVAEVDFTQAGVWTAQLTPADGEAAGDTARMVFPVAERSATPAIGTPAPASANRTAKDVASLAELTSDLTPDPDLYAMTVAQAVLSGKPAVIAFATPAFCQSATCGPQVEVIKRLKANYQGQANFIHVEIYANPLAMRTDPSKGVLAPAVTEWNLPSEPWVFIVDSQGKVAAKFEGYASPEELEAALLQALG
ncbi:MAG: hypothetical protein HYU30_06260 [Chloroflexi bacterium]|nr:hypothetical protein [Chloroflexota bacterium]